jgi:hypothetical protein
MKPYSIEYEGVVYVKVSKAEALKTLLVGKAVWLCTHKMRPFTQWHIESQCTPLDMEASYGSDIAKGFNKHIDSYVYYNCSFETGYYPAYYVQRKRLGR